MSRAVDKSVSNVSEIGRNGERLQVEEPLRVYCNKLPPGSTVVKNLPTPGDARDTVHGVAKSRTRLSIHTHTHSKCSVAGERRKESKKKIQAVGVRFCHFLKAA